MDVKDYMKQEHEWIQDMHRLSILYNEERAHRDFQSDEVYKFIEWVHKQYGYVYLKPELTSKNHK